MQAELLEVVLTAFTTLLCGVAAIGFKFLRSQTKLVSTKLEGTKYSNVVNIITETIDDILTSLETTIISELKEKTADGVLTADEIDEIVKEVKNQLSHVLNDRIKSETILNFVDDYDEWIETKIKAIINKHLAKQ